VEAIGAIPQPPALSSQPAEQTAVGADHGPRRLLWTPRTSFVPGKRDDIGQPIMLVSQAGSAPGADRSWLQFPIIRAIEHKPVGHSDA
jgi:hypothetical protein